MNNKSYQICEYGTVRKAEDFPNETSNPDELYIPEKFFNSLYAFILSNQPLEGDIPFSIFSKGKKLQIKVRNYVGIIETKEGISLEILPKIFSIGSKNIESTRRIFLKMLKHLKSAPFTNLSLAHLSSKERFPILEVFIKSYIEEAEKLFNNGIKAGYIIKEENLKFLKGKVIVSKNIKHNLQNQSHFFCEYSELSEDIPQNRIIKKTILKLLKTTRNYSNYALLSRLLIHLKGVRLPNSIEEDFEIASAKNRLFKSYKQLLEWSKIFLLNRGFTNFKGDSLNTAILFPMEKVFEGYISFLFNKYTTALKIKAQDRSYFLVEKHGGQGKFRLRPDLYLEKTPLEKMIIDIKWKLINENKPHNNYDIKIADMYQLYAYGKKYSDNQSKPQLAIIYPKSEYFSNKLDSFIYEDGLELNIYPFDFEQDEEIQINKILS